MTTSQDRGAVVAHTAMLPDDTPLAATVEGRDVVVVRHGDTIRAYEGRCPHRGAPLAEGVITDGTLVCPGHGWRFDLVTGRNADPTLPCLQPVATRVDHDHVVVGPTPMTGANPETTRTARPLRELPGPTRVPLLGNLLQIDRTRVHQVLEDWQRIHGPVYRIALGRAQALVTGDPQLVGDALRRRPDDFRRLSSIASVLQDMTGTSARANASGVFDAEGDDWRRQRSLVARALDARHVRRFLPTLVDITGRLRQRWEAAAAADAVVDVRRDLMRYTVDVTAGLVFGHDIDTLSGDEDAIQRHLALTLTMLNRRMMSPVTYWRVIRLPADRRLDAALDEVHAYCRARIADTHDRLATDPELATRPTNLLEALIVATTDDGAPLTEGELIANMVTMLVAGEDTTANTITWAVHLLTHAPAVRAKLQHEIATIGNGDDGVACVGSDRLPYTDAIVSETMRLKPVAPLIFLEANRDVVLGDVAVPAGASVMLLTRPAGMSAAVVDEPRAFRPERWLGPAPSSSDWRADLAPFGAGPRFCPGRGLALIEARLALTMLYRHFDVQPVGDPGTVREQFSFTMEPTDVQVRLRTRP